MKAINSILGVNFTNTLAENGVIARDSVTTIIEPPTRGPRKGSYIISADVWDSSQDANVIRVTFVLNFIAKDKDIPAIYLDLNEVEVTPLASEDVVDRYYEHLARLNDFNHNFHRYVDDAYRAALYTAKSGGTPAEMLAAVDNIVPEGLEALTGPYYKDAVHAIERIKDLWGAAAETIRRGARRGHPPR